MNIGPRTAETKEPLLRLIQDYDYLYDRFYSWLAGQYDAGRGGFYYATSSIHARQFEPDIESTAQAISILERSGLIPGMPESIRGKLISYFRSRQTPEGYFIDQQNEMANVDRMVGRAVSYSSRCLALLGSAPEFPIPGETADGSLPGHLERTDSFRAWIDERPWDNAWMACDNISVAASYLRRMTEERRRPFMDYLWKYLEEHQDGQSGMWGGGIPYVQLSGAFKLTSIYRSFGVPMPRAVALYSSLLDTLRTQIPEDMCWTRNTMDLLITIRPQLPEIDNSEKQEILKLIYGNLSRHLRTDGGFSRLVNSSLAIPNNVPLGLGLKEGDMNASTQALRIRSLAHALINEDDAPLPVSRTFYEQVQHD